MPIQTFIDETLGIAIQRLVGDLKGDEVIEAQKRLYLNPDHNPNTPVLWDSRDGRVSAVAYEEMKRMTEKSKDFWANMGQGKTAILVADDADFGMARMYQSLAAQMPRSIQVFREYSEAVTWLLTP